MSTAPKKTAVVTGATGGMGRLIVADLARDHHVYALGRNPEKLAELDDLANVTALAVDLTVLLREDADLAEYPGLAALGELGHVDLLVHGAGLMERRSVEQATAADWQLQFNVNAVLPALLTRLLLPTLRTARGQIIFINSINGQTPAAGHSVYVASKHALRGIADSLRDEVSPDGVRVASLFPSGTDTAMMRKMVAQVGEDVYRPEYYSDPAEIARAVRLIADTGETTQFTNLDIRPRRP
ncbi:SDR family oxidoreductase [Corynebacterium halotolerans]|uniref:SDR family oxidoreductase n=1 Tax=Corynebacterium halotolerans TaxID=225326 RepID=UPI003CED9E15